MTSDSPSILELFPHDSIPTLSFLLSHLHSIKNPNLIPYLVNFLYKYDLHEIQLYIPQILNIYLVIGDNALERFILDSCLKDWMLGSEIYWKCCSMAGSMGASLNPISVITSSDVSGNGALISTSNSNGSASSLSTSNMTTNLSTSSSASTPSNVQPKSTTSNTNSLANAVSAAPVSNPNSLLAKNKMKYLAKEVERVLVERTLPKKFGGRAFSELVEQGEMDASYLSAVSMRQCSFHDMLYFVDFLIDLTRRLMFYPLGPLRNTRLRLELRQFMNDASIPQGVFWPLGSTNDNYERIVNICVDECFALSTKERVPCLIYLEVLQDPKHKNSNPPHLAALTQQKTPTKSSLHRSWSGDVSLQPENENNSLMNSSQVHFRSLSSENWEIDDDLPITPLSTTVVRNGSDDESDESKYKESSNSQEEYDSDEEFLIVDVPDRKEMLLHSVFGESWEARKQRIREQSPFGKHPHWDLRSFIVKSNSDIRQEEFCMQLIRLFKQIWMEAKLPVKVCDYKIFSTNGTSGLIETIRDSVSYDGLIKNFGGYTCLLDYFLSVYGSVNSSVFRTAQANFTESLAAYSVICYLLQIKDRHNGNIMIDREGNIIHIDFGFFLGSAPGIIQFENVPFKLTKSFVEVMAGTKENPEKSVMFEHFKVVFGCCFRTAIQHKERFLGLVRSMLPSALSFPCFEKIKDSNDILRRFEERFHAELNENELEAFLTKLIDDSYMAQRTWAYDWYQNQTNGLRFEA